jgi:CubicO group peptidase (beta-lactamase class C family)
MKKTIHILVILLASFHVFGQNDDTQSRLDRINQLAEASLSRLHVPGIAIAIVQNDEVVFSKGYGVRNTISGVSVDDSTLFAIASNSKAFTAASLAILVDRGMIRWDDKVRKYLPYFTLYSPYVSDETTTIAALPARVTRRGGGYAVCK